MTEKQTVLVTGASKGIGRAIALETAKAGYEVVVHYGKDLDGAQQVLQEIMQHGGSGRLLSFDIAKVDECQQVLAADISEHGVYYGVVLNAGVVRDNAFPALTDEDWGTVIHTNLDGFYHTLKPIVMPMVRKRKPARIITLSSVSGMVGNRGQVNYSAAKAGIIGATKALAVELGKRGITVNCIAPGIIESQMTAKLPIEEICKTIPLRRIGKPQEVAASVVFLLSEDAGYITRQVIAVNGGMV